MKRLTSWFLALLLVISLANPIVASPETDSVDINVISTTQESINVEAKGAILMGLDNGEILFSKDANKKLYPASTTKILTALVALENGDLDEVVTVGNEAYLCPYDSSKAGLDIGEEITLENLLYGLMLPSGNDAAYTIAVHIGRKVKGDPTLSINDAVKVFIDLMNKRSRELGAKNSHFVTPDGYHDDEHFTTPYDMALISAEAMKHDMFRKIVSTRMFTIPDWSSLHDPNVEDETRYWRNSNALIHPNDTYYYADATGIKTGYTSKALHCLVTSASRDNMELLTVVLGSTKIGKWTDSAALLDYGFNNFDKYEPFSHGQQISILNIQGNTEDNWVRVISDKAPGYLVPKDKINSVRQEIKWADEVIQGEDQTDVSIPAPVSKHQKVGTMIISLDGKVLDKIDLVTSRAVEKEKPKLPKALIKLQDGIDHSLATVWASFSLWTKLVFGLVALIIFLLAIRIRIVRRRRRRYTFKRGY
ncbi:MAG: D-alanyl-D-alanine carboxypeptidase family protein [Caldicoprobacterales bacterium]